MACSTIALCSTVIEIWGLQVWMGQMELSPKGKWHGSKGPLPPGKGYGRNFELRCVPSHQKDFSWWLDKEASQLIDWDNCRSNRIDLQFHRGKKAVWVILLPTYLRVKPISYRNWLPMWNQILELNVQTNLKVAMEFVPYWKKG
jgi:hypothetical protein